MRVVRPLARRRRMIARPARVRIRARKPCLRFRLRLFGWYVRFMLVLEFRRSAECDRSWAAAVATIRSGGEAAAAPAWRTQRTVIVHRQLGVPPARWADQRSRCNDDRVGCVAVKCRNGPNPPQPRSPRHTRRGPRVTTLNPKKRVAGARSANLYSGPAFGRHTRPGPSLVSGRARRTQQRGGVRSPARRSGVTASLVHNPRERQIVKARTPVGGHRQWHASTAVDSYVDNRPMVGSDRVIAADEKEGPCRWIPSWAT